MSKVLKTPIRRSDVRQQPAFIISIDFELHWGVRDKRPLSACKDVMLGARRAIPLTLELFEAFGVHATWATVGFLFCESREELLDSLPTLRPSYHAQQLCPYRRIENEVGENEEEDPFHFASSLIRRIGVCEGQEIATHTFSHYYCLEPGQSRETFRADLEAAVEVARRRGFTVQSIVFPRNQFNEDYLSVCAELGVKMYRGNRAHWMYREANVGEESLGQRAARLLDAYLPLAPGSAFAGDINELPWNVPATRYLRPYNPRVRRLEPLRLARIKSEMLYAARTGGPYHLWWHPHNFGSHVEKNLAFLQQVLEYYRVLRDSHGVVSQTMLEWGQTHETLHHSPSTSR